MTATHFQPRSRLARKPRRATAPRSTIWAMRPNRLSRHCGLGAGGCRERDQLSRMDDRMLADIGLTRADAKYLSDKPFWRE